MMKHIKIPFLLTFLAPSLLFSSGKETLLDLTKELAKQQCYSKTVKISEIIDTTDKIDGNFEFSGPKINCNGEVEFEMSQFEEMADKMEQMLKEALENVQLMAEAKIRKDLIDNVVGLIAYMIVFKPSTATEYQAMGQALTNCITGTTDQATEKEMTPGAGDESNGLFLGLDIGKLGELTECANTGLFPEGMGDKQMEQYLKVKAELKTLIHNLLSGNINLMINMAKLPEPGWCKSVTKEYNKESGLLMAEMGSIVLLDGSIMSASYTISNEDKSDEELQTEADEEKEFKKSVARNFVVKTTILKDDEFKYVTFLDMLSPSYNLYLTETKTDIEKLSIVYKLNNLEKAVMDFISSYIFEMEMENGSPVPYYYTLYFLNKPVKYYFKKMVELANKEPSTRKLGYDGLPGIKNNFYKNYEYSSTMRLGVLQNLKNIQYILDGVTLKFINKYEFIKNLKFEKYNTQIPNLYGHVYNETLNNFLERDKNKFDKKINEEEVLFNMQMMIKQINNKLGNKLNKEYDIKPYFKGE